MKPRRCSSEGIVLARRNYGEADRILVVFSKHFGKLHLLAKGTRLPKSHKRGYLEIFSQIKFSTARGKGLDLMTEVEIIQNFGKVRKSLEKVAVAYFLMETVSRMTHDEERNEKLYEIILSYLRKLQLGPQLGFSLKRLRENFVYDCLVLLGFWPKGRLMRNPDMILQEIAEREMSTIRVGKKILT